MTPILDDLKADFVSGGLMASELSLPQVVVEERHFMTQVFGWMSMGLALTGGVAAAVASTPALAHMVLQNRLVFFGLIIFQLILVFRLAGVVQSAMSASAATAMFLFYAALNGLTLSVIFLAYTSSSIATAFFVTAGTFGIMSLYGYFTKADLTGLGHLCFMALIGLIIASVVNLWFHNPTVMWITTYAGVLIFIGLTAYDTQKIKEMFRADEDGEQEQKEAISGALALYLDFINLFLSILQIMGRRRD
jgi:FtsH-binding integral membrane protein